MVKPFRLIYLAKEGGGLPPPPPLLTLTIACGTFCLVLTYRPIPAIPEYKLKVVNICEVHGIGGLEVVALCAFDRLQRYVQIVHILLHLMNEL